MTPTNRSSIDRRAFIKGATAVVGGVALLGHGVGCMPAPIVGEGYELVWQDDFDVLNPTWQPEPWYASSFDWTKVRVANSILTLTADLTPAAPYHAFTTLASIGPFAASYPHRPQAKAWKEGFFEIRARCTRHPWSKLALWFMNLEASNRWPDPRNCAILNAEWDMIENGVRSWDGPTGYADVNHVTVLHRDAGDQCGIPEARRLASVEGLSGLCDWHVWAGKWTRDALVTYLDGQPLTVQPTYDSTAQPMYLLLSAAPSNSPPPDGSPRPATMTTEVDWVRVWQKPG